MPEEDDDEEEYDLEGELAMTRDMLVSATHALASMTARGLSRLVELYAHPSVDSPEIPEPEQIAAVLTWLELLAGPDEDIEVTDWL